MKRDNKKELYENIMSSVAKEVKKALNERMIYHDLYDALAENITRGIIEAWDDCGFEFTHNDIKITLQRLADEYDVDEHIDWAAEHMD